MLDALLCLSPAIVYGLLYHNKDDRNSNEQGMTTTTRRRASWISPAHDKSAVPTWKPEDAVCSITMAGTTRRRSSIDRASIAAILSSGANSQPASPPSPHFTTSSHRASMSAMDPPPPAAGGQKARPLSFTPRSRPNRLSLQFPVSTTTESARPTPTSAAYAGSIPPTPVMSAIPSPSDPSGAFLEALAGQERKVLELKEELEKAEKDLDVLKRKWAHHEATKKRAEIRHVEPLQPLQSVVSGGDRSEEDGKTLRQSIELDRRKALLATIPKESRRKVFTGHHTRALSLLSPDRSTYAHQPFPPVRETSADGRGDDNGLPRSTTMPDTSQGMSRISQHRTNRHSYQGTTNNVKQIAEDVKAGLWTFLEDLRQATVGDEAVNGTSYSRSPLDGSSHPGLKRTGSKGSLLTGDRGRNARAKSPVRTWDSLTGTSPSSSTSHAWPEQNSDTRSKSPVAGKKKSKSVSVASTSIIDDLDDDWSNWDSPTPNSPRWSGTTLEDPLTPMKQTAVKSNETPPSKKDEIPWPDLKQLTPSHLHRTVSTIMKEWEKSLTPPAEDSKDPLSVPQRSQSQSAAHAYSNIDACLM